MSSFVPKSHDAFFKEAMQERRVAREFFEMHLPPDVQAMIDLTTLKPESELFINHTLGEGQCDLLFSVTYNSHQKGYLYILVEQQSTNDPLMAFRLAKYMLRICDKHLKAYPDAKKLPLVFPCVFYTGNTRYTAPRTLWELYEDPVRAESFFTDPYPLVHLQTITDDALLHTIWAGSMQFIMKHIYARDIAPYIRQIKDILAEVAVGNYLYLEAILHYTLHKGETERESEILECFKEIVPEEKREGVMTGAERLIARGIQQGIQQGMREEKKEMVKKMLSKGQSVEFVAEMTDLSLGDWTGDCVNFL